MVAQPEKVPISIHHPPLYVMHFQWVNDIADAGGSLFCFHLEATSQ